MRFRVSHKPVPRIRQGSAKSAGTSLLPCSPATLREAEPFVAPTHRIWVLWIGPLRGAAFGQSGLTHQAAWSRDRMAPIASHRCRDLFCSPGAGWFRSARTARSGPAMVWINFTGVLQKIRALGSVPLTFCAPAARPTYRNAISAWAEAAVIGAWP